MKHKSFHGFEDDLKETFDGYRGVHSELLNMTPDMFTLLCDLMQDERVKWDARMLVNAALSYLVVPSDIIPEDEYGEIGYIDDLFLCAYILNEMKEKGLEAILRETWKGGGDVISIVDEVLPKSRELVREREEEILDFVGLRGFKQTY